MFKDAWDGRLKKWARSCNLAAAKKKGGGFKEKICPFEEKICLHIVRAAGSLFIVADGSPLAIIQRLLRETRTAREWSIHVFKAVWMYGRRATA